MLPPARGTLNFSYIRRLGPFIGVQTFEFQYFLGFQKKYIFWGSEDFVDLWDHHKSGLFWGLFLCELLKLRYRMIICIRGC